MKKTEDVRITKSKRDLRNALLLLLKTNHLEDITVNKICETAMVNRMTFYKHYADKYALLDDCIQSIATDIYTKTIGDKSILQFKTDPVNTCVKLLKETMTICLSQRDVIFSLMYCNNTLNWFIVKHSIEKFVKGLINEIIKISQPKYSVEDITSFLTGGFSNLILDNLVNPNNFDLDIFIKDCSNLFSDILEHKILFY